MKEKLNADIMKQYKIPILSAIIGSALTLLVFWAFTHNEANAPGVQEMGDIPSANVVYTTNEEGEMVSLDFTEISKKLMNAVVHISSIKEVQQPSGRGFQQLPDPFREFFRRYNQQPEGENPRRQQKGAGSGVIINSEGYIVTNNHVIAEADEVEVTLFDNRSYTAKVIGTDPLTDLALVQIDETGLPTIPMVDSDKTEVGEWVLAVGNPFNLNSTVTAGIISAKSRSINILRNQYAIESFIQTDAAINPGNSGGALVNLQGGLVGINTAIASPTGSYTGYGFAVPSNIVNKVISDLLEYGSVQRGYLGVTIRNVTSSLAEEEGLDITEGVYIDSVQAESAAGKAGLKKGDVVTAIEGTNVSKAAELQEMVARQRPGDKVELEIKRNGRTIERTATLQSMEGATEVSTEKRGEMLSELGAELATVTEEKARELNIDGGVRITRLYPGKLRKNTNIKEGFIILRVNTQPVTSVAEMEKILSETSGGVMLEGIYESAPRIIQYYAFGLD